MQAKTEFTFTVFTNFDSNNQPYSAYLSSHLEDDQSPIGLPFGNGKNEYEAIADLCRKIAALMPVE